jgi:FkbM family methyltransferase
MQITNNNFWVMYPNHTKPTFLENERTQQEHRTLALNYVTNWNNCIDIGSHVGMWTRELATRFKKVYCFEPNPLFIECFNKNITENNVELFQYGLSNKEHKASTNKQATMLKSDNGGTVVCKTLDSFNLKDIDFIKIDVDGFEYKVLRGAIKTIRDSSPTINIELKRDKRKAEVVECRNLLRELGYNRMCRERMDEVWVKYKRRGR